MLAKWHHVYWFTCLSSCQTVRFSMWRTSTDSSPYPQALTNFPGTWTELREHLDENLLDPIQDLIGISILFHIYSCLNTSCDSHKHWLIGDNSIKANEQILKVNINPMISLIRLMRLLLNINFIGVIYTFGLSSKYRTIWLSRWRCR